MVLEDSFSHLPKKLQRLPENPEKHHRGRFPSWLHRKMPVGDALKKTKERLKGLNTVCEEAKCPNLLECWSKKTATFLILGSSCTRACGFCDIDFDKSPQAPDTEEPNRVANSVKQLDLKHVVITQVARDDLMDGGVTHLQKVVNAIREGSKEVTVEVLTSDFAGNIDAWHQVMEIVPEIFNYNIETVERLTPRVRHKATYQRTLAFIQFAQSHKRHKKMLIKSGMMVGLGEKEEEVYQTITDLHSSGCDIITIGQYLQASAKKLRVKEFITPEQFNKYERFGYNIGVKKMYCGPLVRSSYNAGEIYKCL